MPELNRGINSALNWRSLGLFGIHLRQTTGFVERFPRLAGLNWNVPEIGTLFPRQKRLNITIPYHGGTVPLHLLMDEAGIEVKGEAERNTRKQGRKQKAPVA